MQTFLPFESMRVSLTILDRQRLGKQRVEAMQIVNSLLDPNYGYRHHPVKLLWQNHIDALRLYHNICLEIWESRGYANNMLYYDLPSVIMLPVFSTALHESHASNLLRKDFTYYSQFVDVAPDLAYVWEAPIDEYLAVEGSFGYLPHQGQQ